MIELLIFLFLVFIIIPSPSKRKSFRGSPNVYFCDDGIEGHERRVADFYGDDYDEIIADRKRRIKYVKKYYTQISLQDYLKEKRANNNKEK